MEKAIEIKRRAQRCIQNGDLDGALQEYEKLVGADESDPYNYVLLADLLYKKADMISASERYLSAVAAYEKASLYKNAIAVCKKMMRLSLSPAKTLQSLAKLHALDGLAGEAALYHMQFAEHMVRANEPGEAAQALRQAFDLSQENIKVLEQLADAYLLAGENDSAVRALSEAASHYQSRGMEADARRVLEHVATMDPAAAAAPLPKVTPAPPPQQPSLAPAPAPSAEAVEPAAFVLEPTARASVPSSPAESRLSDFESGRHESAPRVEAAPPQAAVAPAAEPVTVEVPSLGAALPDESANEPAGHGAKPGESDSFRIPSSMHTIAARLANSQSAPQAEPEPEVDEAPVAETHVPTFEIPAEDEAAPVYEIVETPEDEAPSTSPAAPGLAFGSGEATAPAAAPEEGGMAAVERLLTRAQDEFRAGEREAASRSLTEAAQAYEILGRHDSAATIYRSLGHGAHATQRIMTLWLANCEARNDRHEAAQVACELGDRALNDGDEPAARTWFEKAVAFDSENEVARRRLQRLSGGSPSGSIALATALAQASPPANPNAPPPDLGEAGRVEVAVGRGEAVTFDLSGLLAEFQRGVETQLAGDAQSHYDLGMTYREMGLLEQALDSFTIAEQDPRLTARALEMKARCFADQGRHAEAIAVYRQALDGPEAAPETLAELRIELAATLVASGDTKQALVELEQAGKELPGDPMIAERIAEIRGSLGSA